MRTETIHYLSQEELKALLKQAKSKRDKALIFLAYSYGLRASEVGLLRREDIDFERMKIRIHRLKNSISSEYPLRPEVARLLKSYLRTRKDNSPILFPSRRGLPINRRTLYNMIQRYAKQAKIPKSKRYFHVLKHSIAVHLLEAEMDIIFVKDWLGHKNIQNTMIYARLVGVARDELARRVFASPKIV
jgi:type 1 fimbriae regulatory protein FimB